MATGANRGAYYAGFMAPLQQAGISFELLAGASAGGIAAAWIAAGDSEAYVDSWRQADRFRVALHPALAWGRRRTVDRLIQTITLRTMDLSAARTARAEVRVAVSRIVGRGFPLPRLEQRVLSNRDAGDDTELGLMLRATAFVPWINGLSAAVTIDGSRYLDGGLVDRVPLSLIPAGRFDEIWISACSPNGLRELGAALKRCQRRERLIVVTPSEPLPTGRWTMAWTRISQTIELGRRDMATAIEQARHSTGNVFIPARREATT
jgi:predicted acylesterase/phospholipase RssA